VFVVFVGCKPMGASQEELTSKANALARSLNRCESDAYYAEYKAKKQAEEAAEAKRSQKNIDV
jgi:hypothetical protein